MLRSRIIPCLLVHNKGLVKTVKFSDPKYVGDPINAVKIFNEKEVDELIVLDIDATVQHREPDYVLIEKLAVECRMPLCYGGGIKTVAQAARIIQLGVEKIALSSAIIENPCLVASIAQVVGTQSVVAVLDVKKNLFGSYALYTQNGLQKSPKQLVSYINELEQFGIGEIVVNAIDRDGTMKGYDRELINIVRSTVDVPITALGGAGSINDLKELIGEHKIIGAAAGSLFVFKGVYKAVLINYPSPGEIVEITSSK